MPGPPSVEPYQTLVIVSGKRLADALDQLGRRRRRARVGRAQRCEVEPAETVVEDPRPHGGDAVELGGAAALDRVQ